MNRRLSGLFSILLVSLGLFACGSGGHQQLTSIAVSPATADAQTFPDGQVQFTATGTFSNSNMAAAPVNVLWSIGNPFSKQPIPGGVSLDSNGLAQCTGFVGTVTIWATAPADTSMSLPQMNMTTKNVSGTAQLTCP
jgi:hypothetical protein